MAFEKRETLQITTSNDVVLVRQLVRQWSTDLGFSLIEQTKLVTAASEIARNTLIHGGGGAVEVNTVTNNGRPGLKLQFTDKGPGITNLALAMEDGYTSNAGLGLGLGGAKRLVNEFDIVSTPGEGTTVTLVRWKS